MKRRDFVGGLVSAAAMPLAARAQQPAMPVVGFLDYRSPAALMDRLRAFREGLKEEAGYVEGANVAIEYRWAENQHDKLPALATELARRPVALIVASGGFPVASIAKAATTTIPILFIVGDDPVRLGLVASVARPGGNLTGVNIFSGELAAKRLQLLHDLVPGASRAAVLINPANVTNAESTLRDVAAVARVIGLRIQAFHASTSREIDAVFAAFAHERPDALFVGGDAFLDSRHVQLVQLASHHRIPAAYPGREYAEAGGLMSYGSNIPDAYRQLGAYAGRILKGAKPADLPVVQATRFELVVNHQTARVLGLTVPPSLLAIADDVIE